MECLTASLEDYLEIIYILKQNKGAVGITDIAKAFFISKPSVNKAINTLKIKGYVVQEKYGKIELTKEGLFEAKNIYGRHTTLNKFLTEILKVDSNTAEMDACKLEHVLSKETLVKIECFLKNNHTSKVALEEKVEISGKRK